MIYVRNREEWREWLKRNHLKESKVAIVIYKKHTGKPSLSQRESMEEAICFGWIDTTVKRLDKDRYIRNFSRRTANSRWSRNTRRYARDMMNKGKMSAEGMRRYKEGLARKTHDHGIPHNPKVPGYLMAEIRKDRKARENFSKIAPSYRRTLLRWLLHAKLEETKKKRVKIIVQSLRRNQKLFPVA